MEEINHIKNFQWSKRLLIVLDHENLGFSERFNQYSEQFLERDFIIIKICRKKAFINENQLSNKFTNSILKKIDNIKDGHHFILIGKDGQIKNSYPLNINLEEIFIEVDAMPMRKNEISKRNMDFSR
jgi:hypothetical protein